MSRKFRAFGVLLLGTVAFGTSSSPALARVSVFPSPGTQVASDKTQISFRGVKPRHLGKVVVVGSKTGLHRGKLRKHTGGRGVSFIPRRDFAPNERVRVRTDRKIRMAKNGDFSFRIGDFRTVAEPPPPVIPPEGKIPPDAVSFHSRPDLQVPRVTIDTPAAGTARGYIFMAPKSDGPMIVDNAGNLVWFRPGRVADFKVQRFKGKPVLTFWQGAFTAIGVAKGTFLILDRRYRPVMRVRAGNGYGGGLHEFLLTRRGTAFITVYQTVKEDLRRFGGPRNGTVQDSIVQEIDLRTGLVLFEWHSVGHVPLGDSQVPVPETADSGWDYFHINSVSQDRDGNLLVSARNTSAVYRIDRLTGKVMWRLGGKRSNFKRLGPDTDTAWQHTAARRFDGTLSIFDNGAAPPVHQASRALFLRLGGKKRTVQVARAFTHPTGLLANSQGSVQVLRNRNVFVGWGSEPYLTEFSPTGEVLFDAHFAARNSSYRTYRFPWGGRPAERPAIASEAIAGGMVRAWASWNGDTRVATWRLLAGAGKKALAVVGSAPRTGFETEVTATTAGPLVAMQALDAGGKVLGRTAITPVGAQSR